jgi:Transposase DDE domain
VNGAVPRLRQKEIVREKSLKQWGLISQFQARLEAICKRRGLSGSFADPRRHLRVEDYLGLFLFGLLNPVVRTMRALCAASDINRVQREVCHTSVSLGSFSEAQAVLDVELLREVFNELTAEVGALQEHGNASRSMKWMIQDSTLWEALPRMQWAKWRHQHKTQRAVRLHVSFHVADDKPMRVSISEGRMCERKAWKAHWQPGDHYVGDRNFGRDYKIFEELDEIGACFVLRLHEASCVEIEEELPLSNQARSSGVIREAWVRLGYRERCRSMRVRLVWVKGPRETLLLVTNLSAEQMEAAQIAEIYHRRWQIELFFRWIKCILGCRHWLAESQQGVSIQVYLALIAALLLQLKSGRRPTRRMMERIQLYMMGVATEQELEAGLERELIRLELKKRA